MGQRPSWSYDRISSEENRAFFGNYTNRQRQANSRNRRSTTENVRLIFCRYNSKEKRQLLNLNFLLKKTTTQFWMFVLNCYNVYLNHFWIKTDWTNWDKAASYELEDEVAFNLIHGRTPLLQCRYTTAKQVFPASQFPISIMANSFAAF